MRCPECGFENAAGQKFCGGGGTRLSVGPALRAVRKLMNSGSAWPARAVVDRVDGELAAAQRFLHEVAVSSA